MSMVSKNICYSSIVVFAERILVWKNTPKSDLYFAKSILCLNMHEVFFRMLLDAMMRAICYLDFLYIFCALHTFARQIMMDQFGVEKA